MEIINAVAREKLKNGINSNEVEIIIIMYTDEQQTRNMCQHDINNCTGVPFVKP